MPKDRQVIRDLAPDARVIFERSSAHPVEYAIMLVVERDNEWHTMRAFDNAHRSEEHHEHHYIGDEKQPPTITTGSVNVAMGNALDKLLNDWQTDAMNTAAEHTNRLFMSAALSDDDRGYPFGTSFVSHEQPDWGQITMRNLRSGQPTVVVTSEGFEYLLLPHTPRGVRGWADHMFRRRWAEVYWRHGDHTHGGFEVSVSRDTLERFERQPHFA